jgi:hypothetical protein
MAGTVHIPWYATGLRGDKLETALLDVTPTALRYSATGWSLHRSQDDRYKFLQIVHFDDKTDFDRWWQGREMIEFRAITSGWWQVPVLYTPHDLVGEGRLAAQDADAAPAPAESEPAATA